MTLRFRNLEVSPDDPVERWGPEGILAAIDRGGLAEWRRITRAVEADPQGPVAADLEEALESAEDAGAARVLRLALDHSRASEAERLGWRIREYLWRTCLTQGDFARAVGTSPSRMSTYINGSVTPSAVMLERMRRVAEEASRQLPLAR